MKKAHPKKPISGKSLATLITVLVFLASTALVTFTVVVFMRTLTSVSNTSIDTTKSAKLAGIDGALLNSLLQFHTERRAQKPLEATHLNNPFVPLPLEAAPVAAAPAPAPAPTEGQPLSGTAPAAPPSPTPQ